MPKVIYANLIWLFIIVLGAIAASIFRHASGSWDIMPDVRMNYDILFVCGFCCLFIISLIGILKRKKWGYEFTMCFNYILIMLAFIPIIIGIIYALKSSIPFHIIWNANLQNLIIGVVSIVFVFFMKRSNIKSLFNESM